MGLESPRSTNSQKKKHTNEYLLFFFFLASLSQPYGTAGLRGFSSVAAPRGGRCYRPPPPTATTRLPLPTTTITTATINSGTTSERSVRSACPTAVRRAVGGVRWLSTTDESSHRDFSQDEEMIRETGTTVPPPPSPPPPSPPLLCV